LIVNSATVKLPKAATPCIFKELIGFNINALIGATCGKGEGKSDQFGKRQVAISGKIYRRLFVRKINVLRNDKATVL
jgi:hypothetical protein